ncbi:hypothetical protein HDU82_005890 [Entophlyctis luteolus]|nr:hypothetical protein HDU82_005890 [Entophlyctis luteolus]
MNLSYGAPGAARSIFASPECFVVSNASVWMSNYAGFWLPVFPPVFDTASLDAYLLANSPISDGYFTLFRSDYGCPGFSGSGERYHMAMFETELILVAQNIGCPAPARNVLLCPETCEAAVLSLARIFSDTSVCSQAPDGAQLANRNQTLLRYQNVCRQLSDDVGCLVDVAPESKVCGFSLESDQVAYCTAGVQDSCCGNLTSKANLLFLNDAAVPTSSSIIASNSDSVLFANSGFSVLAVIGLSLGFIAVIISSVVITYCYMKRRIVQQVVFTTSQSEQSAKKLSVATPSDSVAAIFMDGGRGVMIPYNAPIPEDNYLTTFSWDNVYNAQASTFGTMMTFHTSSIETPNVRSDAVPMTNLTAGEKYKSAGPSIVEFYKRLSTRFADRNQNGTSVSQEIRSQFIVSNRYSIYSNGYDYENSSDFGDSNGPSENGFRRFSNARSSQATKGSDLFRNQTFSSKNSKKDIKPTSMTGGGSPMLPELFKVQVLFPYQPAMEDELALTVGQVLTVHKIFDDGQVTRLLIDSKNKKTNLTQMGVRSER